VFYKHFLAVRARLVLIDTCAPSVQAYKCINNLAYTSLLELVLLTTATCINSPQSKHLGTCLSTEQDFYSDSPKGTNNPAEHL